MKFIAKIIIIVVIFFAGFYVGQKQLIAPNLFKSSSNQVESDQQNQISLMLDFGNGDIKIFNDIAINDNTTVFNVLEKITLENNIEFKYKDYGDDLGVMVESINNVANNASFNRFWQYWVNNKYAEVGASNYVLQLGDVVEWKYIKGQFN